MANTPNIWDRIQLVNACVSWISYVVFFSGQEMRRNSTLEDWPRVRSLKAYIGAVLDSLRYIHHSFRFRCLQQFYIFWCWVGVHFSDRNGSNMRGYFTWSLLDTYELLDGYNSGFGLYYVDLDDPDLKRYPKLSSYWYSHFLKGGNSNNFIMNVSSIWVDMY